MIYHFEKSNTRALKIQFRILNVISNLLKRVRSLFYKNHQQNISRIPNKNYSFILRRQPKSYNSWKKNSTKGQQYLNDIRQSFSNLHQNLSPKSGDLYGIAYYFHSHNTGTDADNISKPIWDSLTGFLYQDDRQVKLRVAGSFDLNQNDFNLLDITGVPGNVVVELIDAINNEQHIVFIECGSLDTGMYKFNLG